MTTSLSPARRVLLGISGLLLVAIIVQAGLAVIAFYGRTTYVATAAIDPSGGRLQVHSRDGDVSVRPSADGRIHIETRARYGLRRPKLEQRSGVGGIELVADCSWFDSQCGVDYDIRVPEGQGLVVSTGSGDISVSDLTASAQLSTGSGDITTTRMSGPTLELRSGSGDLRIVAARVPAVAARTGSGNVSAEFAVAPTDVEARTGSGDVRLVVPSASYAVDVDTGSGDRTIEVATDPQSTLRLFARTGSGDVRVIPAR